MSINFASSVAAAGEKVLSHTAILPLRKSVAYRKSPLLLLPIARPLYTGPAVRSVLGTTVTALGLRTQACLPGGNRSVLGRPHKQRCRRCGLFPTANAIGLPFQTMPEGPGAPALVSPRERYGHREWNYCLLSHRRASKRPCRYPKSRTGRPGRTRLPRDSRDLDRLFSPQRNHLKRDWFAGSRSRRRAKAAPMR